MKCKMIIFIFFFTALFIAFFVPDHALATQAHGAPEGVYVHQFAHVFFIISMGFLIHWLRERKLVNKSGWRFIQYAAFFLIFWNIDALTVHLLADQLEIIQVTRISTEYIQINALNGCKGLEMLYYMAKLDHLFCVPALFFLYLGLRRLLKENHSNIIIPEIKRNGQS